MNKTTAKEHSRIDYELNGDHGTWPQIIAAGSLQRIADAVEKIAEPHREAIDRAALYERRYKESRDTVYCIRRRLAAQKGQCTKLRNQIARLYKEAK